MPMMTCRNARELKQILEGAGVNAMSVVYAPRQCVQVQDQVSHDLAVPIVARYGESIGCKIKIEIDPVAPCSIGSRYWRP